MSPCHPPPVTPLQQLIGPFPVQTSWGQSGCGMQVSPFPTPSGFFCSCLSPVNCPRATNRHQHQISPWGDPGMSPLPGLPLPVPSLGTLSARPPVAPAPPAWLCLSPRKIPEPKSPLGLFPGGSVCPATTLVTRRSPLGTVRGCPVLTMSLRVPSTSGLSGHHPVPTTGLLGCRTPSLLPECHPQMSPPNVTPECHPRMSPC